MERPPPNLELSPDQIANASARLGTPVPDDDFALMNDAPSSPPNSEGEISEDDEPQFDDEGSIANNRRLSSDPSESAPSAGSPADASKLDTALIPSGELRPSDRSISATEATEHVEEPSFAHVDEASVDIVEKVEDAPLEATEHSDASLTEDTEQVENPAPRIIEHSYPMEITEQVEDAPSEVTEHSDASPMEVTEPSEAALVLDPETSISALSTQDEDGDVDMTEATPTAETRTITTAPTNTMMFSRNQAPIGRAPFAPGMSSFHQYDADQYNGPSTVSEASSSRSHISNPSSYRRSPTSHDRGRGPLALNFGTGLVQRPRNPAATLLRKNKFIKMQEMAKQMALKKQAMSKASRIATLARDAFAQDSAMQETDDDDEFYLAHGQYEKAKAKYENIKRNRDPTVAEEVTWMKIQAEESARQRKRKADKLRDQEDNVIQPSRPDEQPLFVPENGDEDEEDDSSFMRRDKDVMDYMGQDPGEGSSRRASIPRKADKSLANPNGFMDSMLVGFQSFQDDGPKKKRKLQEIQAIAQAKGRGKGKGKAKASDKRPTAKRAEAVKTSGRITKNSKPEKYTGPSLTDIGSLFTSNVFRDQEGNADRPDQPSFDKGRKDHALKQLIASVPLEHQKDARADKNALLAATRDFTGHGSCRADGDGKWLVKGMKTSLKAYQLLGSAFMRRRERAAEEPRGGLIADQMGLGKTVMMLANIINGKPPKDKKDGRATLIVASTALIEQWEEEIKRHCHEKAAGAIMPWRAGQRIEPPLALKMMESHDIILTTYTNVMKSYPKYNPPSELVDEDAKQAWWRNEYETKRGPLHRMRFLRVILDEAQAIKNHTGRTSIACRGLMADHKWALSGTPVLNSITELYPYFKFLNIPHTGNFKIFKENYCNKADSDTTKRLLVRLNQFMIRRTHKDIMFGVPILKLPKATPITHWCEFNDIERSVYDIVEKRFISRINAFARNGELDKSYNNIFVMLLRLRQLTGHILTLQYTMEDLLEMEDIERLKQLTAFEVADQSDRGRQIISIRTQLAAMLKKTREKSPDVEASACQSLTKSITEHSSPSDDGRQEDAIESTENHHTGQSFGKTYDFMPYLKTLTEGIKWEAVKQRAKCAKCHESPEVPWITACNHIYCQGCLENIQLEAATMGRERAVCRSCATIFSSSLPCKDDDERESRDNSSNTSDDNSPASRTKGKGRSKKPKPGDEDDWIELPGVKILPSAKTLAIKAQVLNWLQEAPDTKVIIYTQFLAIIRILVKICRQEKWECCEYHGGMSFTQRAATIDDFTKDPSKKILLASLKCGGLGLNLTVASRVIVVDPWWNHALEQQAFCRVFRYGQDQETYMTRFCVRSTVDEKLIRMQERKTAEIDEVMEDDGKTMKKLSLKDLMRLFGPVREAEDGTPFILVEDRQQEGFVDPIEDEDD